MSTVFDYARMAARAEKMIMELLERSVQHDLAEPHPDVNLPEDAQPRQGDTVRGG